MKKVISALALVLIAQPAWALRYATYKIGTGTVQEMPAPTGEKRLFLVTDACDDDDCVVGTCLPGVAHTVLCCEGASDWQLCSGGTPGGGGGGDIASVGDATSGATFEGTNGNLIRFSGSNTADGFETTLTAADMNADRTVTIPNVTGLVCIADGSADGIGCPADGDDLSDNVIDNLSDVTITSVTNAHVLLYDTASGGAWKNQAVTGDLAITKAGVTTIQADAVALGTDTTGNFVGSISLTSPYVIGSAVAGEGPAQSLSFNYSGTLAGSPLLGANECVFQSSVSGGGFICEGTIGGGGDAAEQLYTFPANNGGDTTGTICIADGTADGSGCPADGDDLSDDSINALSDVTITSAANADVLLYDSAAPAAWKNKQVSGDIAITKAGVTTVQSDAVALGTDTTGNYVGSISLVSPYVIGSAVAGEGPAQSLAFNYSGTLAGSPLLGANECVFQSTVSGGGFICEGTTGGGGDAAEQVYTFPATNGADTTGTICIGDGSADGSGCPADSVGIVGDCSTGDCFSGTTGNNLKFEGATADAFEGTLTAQDMTSDITWTLPKRGGNVAMEDRFNVRDYGAAGTGGNDTTAIQAAITAATTNGGTVYFPPGVYGINSTLTIPTEVSLSGDGNGSEIKALSAVAKMVSVDEVVVAGNRGGVIENLFLNCNSTGVIGLYVGLAVQRAFRKVNVESCTDVGVDIVSAQNNLFESIDVYGNGSALNTFSSGMRLNRGAGGNIFTRCEFEHNEKYQLVLHDDNGGSDGFPQGPSANTFESCIFERAQTSGIAQIYIRSGILNYFHNCNISVTSVSHAVSAIKATQEDWASAGVNVFGMDNHFDGGHSTGTTGFTTFLEVSGASGQTDRAVYVDNMWVGSHENAFKVDDKSHVYVGPAMSWYSNTNLYTGTGAEETQLSTSLARGRMLVSRDSSTGAAFQANTYTDANVRWRVLASGLMGWGDGTNSLDLRASRTTLPTSGTPALLVSGPVAIQDTNCAVFAGSGSPEGSVVANACSVYLNTGGGAGTTVYFKESGTATNTGWKAATSLGTVLPIVNGGTNATSFTPSQLIRMNAGNTALESSGKVITDFVADTGDTMSGALTITAASGNLIDAISSGSNANLAGRFTNNTDVANVNVAQLRGPDRTTATNGDALNMEFALEDSGNTRTDFALIKARAVDVTTAAKQGGLEFYVINSGTANTLQPLLKLASATSNQMTAEVNPSNLDVDFLVNADDGTDLIFADATNDLVTIAPRLRLNGGPCLSVFGTEIYHDTNCNGTQDSGENFVDLSNPFGGAIDSGEITDGTIANVDIAAAAGISLTKLALGSTTQIPIMNGATPTWTTLTGDVTVGALGVTAIGPLKVTNGMLAGAIDATTKLTGAVPLANGGTAKSTSWTGSEFVRANAGATALESSGFSDLSFVKLTGGAMTGALSITSATQNPLDVTSSGGVSNTAGRFTNNSDLANANILQLRGPDRTTPANGDAIDLEWLLEDSANTGARTDFALMKARAVDVTTGAKQGGLEFYVVNSATANTLQPVFRLQSVTGNQMTTEVNPSNLDVDFKVNADDGSLLFFTDATNDLVQVFPKLRFGASGQPCIGVSGLRFFSDANCDGSKAVSGEEFMDQSASGETNTASNVGVGGVGVFKQKTGVNLEFKNVNAASARVTITDDTLNNEVDVDVVPSQIDHDALLNFVANEHVDHSTVTLTAGAGLTGTGNITASRTFDIGDGAGVAVAADSIATASAEASFLAAMTDVAFSAAYCTTHGGALVNTTLGGAPMICDAQGTPAKHYLSYGNADGTPTSHTHAGSDIQSGVVSTQYGGTGVDLRLAAGFLQRDGVSGNPVQIISGTGSGNVVRSQAPTFNPAAASTAPFVVGGNATNITVAGLSADTFDQLESTDFVRSTGSVAQNITGNKTFQGVTDVSGTTEDSVVMRALNTAAESIRINRGSTAVSLWAEGDATSDIVYGSRLTTPDLDTQNRFTIDADGRHRWYETAGFTEQNRLFKNGTAMELDRVTGGSNLPATVFQLYADSTAATPAAGLGARLEFITDTSTGAKALAATADGVWGTATNGSQVGNMNLGVVQGGSATPTTFLQLDGVNSRVAPQKPGVAMSASGWITPTATNPTLTPSPAGPYIVTSVDWHNTVGWLGTTCATPTLTVGTSVTAALFISGTAATTPLQTVGQAGHHQRVWSATNPQTQNGLVATVFAPVAAALGSYQSAAATLKAAIVGCTTPTAGRTLVTVTYELVDVQP